MAIMMATQTSVRLNDELEEQLEQYRQSHRFAPSKSDVIRTALKEFLQEELDADAVEQ